MLGGYTEGAHIELHDVVFVAAESLEAAYPDLIHAWFGTNKKIHIDASAELTYVDGYHVQLTTEKPDDEELKLFFVNFGGYRPGYFGEIHEVNFYVAPSKTHALARAREQLCLGTSEQHCDDNVEVDDIIAIDQVDKYYVSLIPSEHIEPLDIKAFYRKLRL